MQLLQASSPQTARTLNLTLQDGVHPRYISAQGEPHQLINSCPAHGHLSPCFSTGASNTNCTQSLPHLSHIEWESPLRIFSKCGATTVIWVKKESILLILWPRTCCPVCVITGCQAVLLCQRRTENNENWKQCANQEASSRERRQPYLRNDFHLVRYFWLVSNSRK